MPQDAAPEKSELRVLSLADADRRRDAPHLDDQFDLEDAVRQLVGPSAMLIWRRLWRECGYRAGRLPGVRLDAIRGDAGVSRGQASRIVDATADANREASR